MTSKAAAAAPVKKAAKASKRAVKRLPKPSAVASADPEVRGSDAWEHFVVIGNDLMILDRGLNKIVKGNGRVSHIVQGQYDGDMAWLIIWERSGLQGSPSDVNGSD